MNKPVGTGRRYQKPGAVCSVVGLSFTRGLTTVDDGVRVGDIVMIISRLSTDTRLCLTSDGALMLFYAYELKSLLVK